MVRILIIDDDDDTLSFVSTCLEDAHDVVTTTNGEKGLFLARQTPFDLVVTDIFMPMKDGLEVVQELTRTAPKTKIIAMTSQDKGGSTDFLNIALRLGANATLTKPLNVEQVQKTVEQVLA